MFYLGQIFYKFTINLTKLSVLTLYLRIFTKRWFIRTCWACFAVVSAYATASILVSVFQCTPLNYYWDRRPPSKHPQRGPVGSSHPHCINTTAFWLSNAVYNITTDVIVLVTLPFVTWSLRLPRRQKIGLTLIFGLGLFVLITSILRVTTLQSDSTAPDLLVGTVVSAMWTIIEASAAVICACLPMCRTPIQRMWPNLLRSKSISFAGGLDRPIREPITRLSHRRRSHMINPVLDSELSVDVESGTASTVPTTADTDTSTVPGVRRNRSPTLDVNRVRGSHAMSAEESRDDSSSRERGGMEGGNGEGAEMHAQSQSPLQSR
jgi:hypothetical protein